jgi:hypothetical protein
VGQTLPFEAVTKPLLSRERRDKNSLQLRKWRHVKARHNSAGKPAMEQTESPSADGTSLVTASPFLREVGPNRDHNSFNPWRMDFFSWPDPTSPQKRANIGQLKIENECFPQESYFLPQRCDRPPGEHAPPHRTHKPEVRNRVARSKADSKVRRLSSMVVSDGGGNSKKLRSDSVRRDENARMPRLITKADRSSTTVPLPEEY